MKGWTPNIKSHAQEVTRDYTGDIICEKGIVNQDQKVDANYGIKGTKPLVPK